VYFDKLESSKLTKNPLVSVWLLTYNHRNYIDFAVKSALNQKTDFNYEIILGDDFSDDGTREIVKMFYCRYPDKIRLILSTKNLWKDYGPLLSLELYKECRGKYIATLEGDDFWSDNLKLQKQVDFLERNPKYSLCSTDYNILKNKFVCVGNIGHNFKNSSFIDFELKDILNKYLLKTCSVLFMKK
jgi:glycosyltransferase involved in cell wall biosynthesis